MRTAGSARISHKMAAWPVCLDSSLAFGQFKATKRADPCRSAHSRVTHRYVYAACPSVTRMSRLSEGVNARRFSGMSGLPLGAQEM